jgi:uncharacterized protein (UPF0276 family)
MAESRKASRFGVGLRRPHFDAIMESHSGVDFLEIVTENFMRFGGRPRQVLERARSQFLVLPHGVGLSIGGPDPLDEDYLAHLEKFLQWLDPPFFSDHLAYSSAFGVEYHDLLPLPFSREVVRHVVERVDMVQSRTGRRMLLENPSYYVAMPGTEMTEAEFITEVVRRSGCGLLLDVNNVYVNSRNHAYDPRGFIDSLPLDAVGYLHIAGHDASGEFIVDTHGDHIAPEVLKLYEYTIARLGRSWTLLEWDNNIPPLEILLRENDSVRAAAVRALAGEPARGVACAA